MTTGDSDSDGAVAEYFGGPDRDDGDNRLVGADADGDGYDDLLIGADGRLTCYSA